MDYQAFATPSSQALYSEIHLNSLTFQQASYLTYPKIGSPHCISGWSFSTDICTSGAATLILPNEIVPPLSCIQPILQEMEDQYARGMRSVHICQPTETGVSRREYHFSKIYLFKFINNFAEPVRFAQQLINYLEECSPPIIPLSYLQQLKAVRIRESVKGFHSVEFPICKLGNLLDENWLEEDVLNCLLELRYLRNHVMTGSLSAPKDLLLPTQFFTDARHLFNDVPRIYSAELIDLRKRLVDTSVRSLGFILCSGTHYTSYFHEFRDNFWEYGDSLHFPCAGDALEILGWVFANLGDHFVLPEHIFSGSIAYQGAGYGGEGSCALAALNFLETHLDKTLEPWSGSKARKFRDRALGELILYHFTVSIAKEKPDDWSSRCISQTPPTDGFAAYNDFNTVCPTDKHPIHSFLFMLSQVDGFMLSQLEAGNHLSSEHSMSLLPPFRFEQSLRPSTPPNSRKNGLRSPSLEFVSPARARPVKRPRPIAVSALDVRAKKEEPKEVILVSDDDVFESGLRLATKDDKKHLFVNLRRPVTPPPSLTSKVEADVIDLVSPVKTADGDMPLASFNTGPRSVVAISSLVNVDDVFDSLDAAVKAVFEKELALGHVWRRGQSYNIEGTKVIKKLTLRCNHYQDAKPVHRRDIDPGDHRQGKSRRTNCFAHVNVVLIRPTSKWRISLVDWSHNHIPEIPVGGTARHRPTQVENQQVAKLATSTMTRLNRSQITTVLDITGNSAHSLEPRQVSNIMNKARREARNAINDLGGDFAAMTQCLESLMQKDARWAYRLKLDDSGVILAFWWQSPQQSELTKRFGDILINDNTYNRNQAGYALNIGVIIDNFGRSRNAWYAFQRIEDTNLHRWILRCHLDSAGEHPTLFMSDGDPAVASAVTHEMPLTDHLNCLYHLDTNLIRNLKAKIGNRWDQFKNDFWAVYRAVSPDEFDRLWGTLIAKYPMAKDYLMKEFYDRREKWAWAWVSTKFTAGIRTNGRVEVENRVNSEFGNAKTSFFQLFQSLNRRTEGQSVDEMRRVRDLSRRQHPTAIERVFPGPLEMLRKYAGLFALATCYQEMKESRYYKAAPMRLPDGMRDWSEYAMVAAEEVGFNWQVGEETAMFYDFTNDAAYISTRWLLRLISGRGRRVKNLLIITPDEEGGTVHSLAILENNEYACDCGMGTTLGIPCRHYFQALSSVSGLKFHLGLIRARWYQDHRLDITTIPPTGCERKLRNPRHDLLQLSEASNTLTDSQKSMEIPQMNSPLPTATIGARGVHHDVSAVVKEMLNGVRTNEEVEDLLHDLREVGDRRRDELAREQIHDPPAHNPKGRPRSKRITGATEGRQQGGGSSRGGGGTRSSYKCTKCKKPGHNRQTCPESQS